MSCPTCHQEFTNVDEFDSHLDSAHQSFEELELEAIAEVKEEVVEFDDADADADADGDADAANNTGANDTEADDADDDNVDDDDDDTPAMDDSNSTETETEQKRDEPVRYLIFFVVLACH